MSELGWDVFALKTDGGVDDSGIAFGESAAIDRFLFMNPHHAMKNRETGEVRYGSQCPFRVPDRFSDKAWRWARVALWKLDALFTQRLSRSKNRASRAEN